MILEEMKSDIHHPYCEQNLAPCNYRNIYHIKWSTFMIFHQRYGQPFGMEKGNRNPGQLQRPWRYQRN